MSKFNNCKTEHQIILKFWGRTIKVYLRNLKIFEIKILIFALEHMLSHFDLLLMHARFYTWFITFIFIQLRREEILKQNAANYRNVTQMLELCFTWKSLNIITWLLSFFW